MKQIVLSIVVVACICIRLSAQNITGEHSLSKTLFGGVDTAWVRNYGSASIPNNNAASATGVDNNGNIYVTGISTAFGRTPEWLTVKYNANGDTVWVSKHSGVGEFVGGPISLVIDGSGNVYISGSNYDQMTGFDYTTIKYNAAGNLLWIRKYNGPGGSQDYPSSLALDGNGNVVVTGESWGSTSSLDFATIKYNSSGDMLWVKRYDGPGNSSDRATSLAIDGNGNIYVTGSSEGMGTGYDYATIKYNSAGDTLWVRRYNGSGNYTDSPVSVTVDDSGNVFVTGSSNNSDLPDADFVTIKYNPVGDTLWVRRYSGMENKNDFPVSVAIDGKGNLYVTGSSYSSDSAQSDFATLKYNSYGDLIWEKKYNGPDNTNDTPTALAIDSDGNIYVTGQGSKPWAPIIHSITIKYNSTGDTMLVREYNFSSRFLLAIDKNANVYETNTGSDFLTVKYNFKGDTLWVRRYIGPGNSFDFASSLAVDDGGNIYVTGLSYTTIATIKYNANGDTLWVRRYDDPEHSFSHATSIIVDKAGNPIVSGGIGIGNGVDYLTIKYNSNGDLLWASRYDDPKNFDDAPTSLAVDDSGNVYVTGPGEVSFNGSNDIATIKYDPNGILLWVRRYNGPDDGHDNAPSLAIDDSGYIYVAGYSFDLSSHYDFLTMKYNPNGDVVWIKKYVGPLNYEDKATSLAIDNKGNIYVTGSSRNNWGGNDDYTTVKYNSNGDMLWVRNYDGTGKSSDEAHFVVVDGNGNVIVTGWSNSRSYSNADYVTIKYTSSGDTLWIQRYNSGGNTDDIPMSLSVDGSGNVYVTGNSGTVKYNSTGVQQWVAPGNRVDLAVDASSNVYVTGSTNSGNSTFYTTVKYIQTPTSVEEKIFGVPGEFRLEQNYPNPFNPSTVIRYQLPVNSLVSLKIYDLLGREVATLVNEEKPAGSYEVTFDGKNLSRQKNGGLASGVYFYKLQAGDFVETKRMLMIK